MHVIDDVNLVEKNARVENVEGRVVDVAGEYDVLEELQPVGVMDLPLYALVSYWYRLVKAGRLVQELPVVGFVGGEFWVVCTVRLDSGDVHELG